MALVMACPKCAGDLDYEVECTDSGDGVWATSGWVGYVLCDVAPNAADGTVRLSTACGCTWTADEIAGLDDDATKLAAEGPSD